MRLAHPATGEPLRALVPAPPPIDEELGALPIAEVFRRLAQSPGARIYDLVQRLDEAPSKVRLAVAWLVEQGAVDFRGGTTIRTQSEQQVDIGQYRDAIAPLGLGDVTITESDAVVENCGNTKEIGRASCRERV